MRILLILVILALLLALIGFASTNLETRAPVTFWQTTYQDVPVFLIVYLSMLAGVVGVGIIAVVDGAFVRLKHRQLAREVRRFGTAPDFPPTQRAERRREPDVPGEGEGGEPVPDEETETSGALASAPVYQAEEIEDDDPYTGGRAV